MHSIAGIVGFWIATQLVVEISFGGIWALVVAGILMGMMNVILKPVRIIFLGIANYAISFFAVWIIDIVLSPEAFGLILTIPGFMPLIWTTLIVAITDSIFSIIFRI